MACGQPSDGVRAKQEESHPLDGEAHKDSLPPPPRSWCSTGLALTRRVAGLRSAAEHRWAPWAY